MKAGTRALGIAESYRGTSGEMSTLAGAVVRANRIADGFAFGCCTVGGTDGTTSIIELYDRLDREDIAFLFLAGIAPAWYNVIDLDRIHDAIDCPVLSISFEESTGLEPALRAEFSNDTLDTRLNTYHAQPSRHRLSVNGETIFVRSVGCSADEATEFVRAFTPEGGRPEPLRIARLAARAAAVWRRNED